MAEASEQDTSAERADAEEIRAALEEASIPALMTALVHMSGDIGILRTEIRPDPNAPPIDPQMGIAPVEQAEIRAKAFEAITAYYDSGRQLPEAPSEEILHEMINFIIAQDVSDEYVEFLMSELSLGGQLPYEQPGLEKIPHAKRQDVHVVIIGAGMSGILAAIRLKEAGFSYTVVEKNADVGGTWLENTYPGCRVDSPNHSYSYSFAPEDWPQYFSPQPVLLDYFQRCATEHGIRENIRFETEVLRADYDEDTNDWKLVVRSTDGIRETLEADAIISAVGQLNRPRIPDIPGRETFAGISFHSAEWEHEHDLTDKRVLVVGTGASAFQFVPEIAEQVSEIVLFQRTPPWVVPREDYHADVPAGKHWLLNNVPFYSRWFRFLMFWRTAEGMLAAVRADKEWTGTGSVSAANDLARVVLTEYVKASLSDDPDLLSRVVPDYPPAGKRMLIDNGGWFRTLKRDDVHLETDPIACITPTGIRTQSGRAYDADFIIYATGFHASEFLWPMEIRGRNGKSLEAHWDGDPRAYLGITIPGFPNLFTLYGPNTNIVVNGSIIFFSECEVRYILGCLKLLLETDRKAMDCRPEVHDAYNERIDAGNRSMAWGSPDVKSWYKNDKGRVTQNWPFTLLEFWQQTKKPDPADYDLLG